MTIAGSTTWLAIAGLHPGGIIGVLLLLVAVTFTAFMTRRGGRQRRQPAGTPIYRREVSYRRYRRRADDDRNDSDDHGDPGDSGGGWGGGGWGGGGCGGGGGGGD